MIGIGRTSTPEGLGASGKDLPEEAAFLGRLFSLLPATCRRRRCSTVRQARPRWLHAKSRARPILLLTDVLTHLLFQVTRDGFHVVVLLSMPLAQVEKLLLSVAPCSEIAVYSHIPAACCFAHRRPPYNGPFLQRPIICFLSASPLSAWIRSLARPAQGTVPTCSICFLDVRRKTGGSKKGPVWKGVLEEKKAPRRSRGREDSM